MSRPSRPSLNLELVPGPLSAALAFHAVRWGLLVGLAMFAYLLFPVTGGTDVPVLEVGDVAPREIIAPFPFAVRKSAGEIEREGAALAATVRPIYEFRPGVVDTVLARSDALFAALRAAAPDAEAIAAAAQARGVRLTREDAAYLRANRRLAAYHEALRRFFQRQLRRGVAATGTIELEAGREIVLRRDGSERVTARESVLTYAQFLESGAGLLPEPEAVAGQQVFIKLVSGLFQPSLVPRTAETEALRTELRASVDSVKDQVPARARIVDRHELVTPEIRDRLLALRGEQLRRGAGEGTMRGAAGQVSANALVLAVFWLLLMFYRPDTYRTLRHMLVLTLLFALVIAGAAVARWQITGRAELIPIPFAAMLITVLFRGRVAMVAAMVLALLLASHAVYGGPDAIFVALVGGVAAAVSVRTIRRRTQFLTPVIVVAAAFVLADVTVGLRAGWSVTQVGTGSVVGAVNALVSAALAFIVLPVFESIGRVSTELTLLELSDPNRPLLRRLATEAPGTYAHSIAMANLCEAACNAIGANGLLARVGCYYHDIGKLKKPQHFVENQLPGSNPHDKLKPDVSAGIIRNHVRDGLALAAEHKLPAVVQAFIPEHHGTMEITYFLERARSRQPEEEIAVEEFRYPGPRPRSVETAVAMLADGVEAALRVLDDPTPQRLSDAIEHIVRQRIEAGQLDEAPITLAQVARIRTEFVRVLTGVHHNRIDYPASGGGISADWEATAPA